MILLANTPLPKEKTFTAFSTADDADNVNIPCTLSLISHELYPNIIAILKASQCYPVKIRLIEALKGLHQIKPEFLRSVKRFEDDIMPLMVKGVGIGSEGGLMVEKYKKACVELADEVITQERIQRLINMEASEGSQLETKIEELKLKLI